MRYGFHPLPALTFVLTIFLAAPVEGLPQEVSFLFRGNILVFLDDGNLPDPMPILPSLGAAVDYRITGPLVLEASLDFYGINYDYSYTLDRAVPASIEYRSAFVVGSVVGLQAVGRFDFTDRMALRVFAGPGADFRLCLLSYGIEQDEVDNSGRSISAIVGDITTYFWSQGRWFLPVGGIGFEYRVLPKVMLGFEGRVWFPLYRGWSGEDLSPLEGWRIAAGLTISLR